ncbi:SSI family serine proteinase inhibitor [Actinomadura sp. NEAU-AAG7]|uniref:SSI family serine proteinase inhibitor n=1 Tax=Actinomadura sp. NEAU-AAG7 TaxID=2839640 RepID=UPI001BE3E5F5|nr:SSI family serine proteinase inhibitor [Actinomadura sp. NEAU-AAG7]MBT2209906.1 hypothetical protein [Actinomadura sp. NEAU-AAG7]
MTRVTLRAILGSALLAGGMGAPAPAATAAEAPHPGTQITLALVPHQGSPGAPRHVVLTCEPAGGPLPHAQEACDELALVNGNVAAVPRRQATCPQDWLPVTASAGGRWRGIPIPSFSQDFQNEGCARIGRGHVFDF